MSIDAGRFNVGNIVIGRNTKVSELENSGDYEIRSATKGRLVMAYADRPSLSFLGMLCTGEAEFFDGRLVRMKLVPFLADAEDYTFPAANDQKKRYESPHRRMDK